VTKSGLFCYGNELKFTYEHLQFQKFFRLASARHTRQGRRKDGTGGEGRGGEGRGRGGEGRGGRDYGVKKSLEYGLTRYVFACCKCYWCVDDTVPFFHGQSDRTAVVIINGLSLPRYSDGIEIKRNWFGSTYRQYDETYDSH
jgi:hypothetical protein